MVKHDLDNSPLNYQFLFFSNLVGEEGPRIQGVKDSRVCFLYILSASLTFFRFLGCLVLLFPVIGGRKLRGKKLKAES